MTTILTPKQAKIYSNLILNAFKDKKQFSVLKGTKDEFIALLLGTSHDFPVADFVEVINKTPHKDCPFTVDDEGYNDSVSSQALDAKKSICRYLVDQGFPLERHYSLHDDLYVFYYALKLSNKDEAFEINLRKAINARAWNKQLFNVKTHVYKCFDVVMPYHSYFDDFAGTITLTMLKDE